MTKKIVLAFSGGLDTSFCVPYLKEKYDADIITVAVNTGGFPAEELAELERKSKALGAVQHYAIDATETLYEKYVSYVIKTNSLRGGVYPLSVAAERTVQAEEIINVAKEEGAYAVAHGSTAAGNDQVRFDVAFRTLAPEIEVIAPIRDLGWTREQEAEYLEARGHSVNLETKEYSINAGLWGTTIGGKETHDSWAFPPEKVFQTTASVSNAPDEPETVEIGFSKGLPVSINGETLSGLEIVRKLTEIGGKHGVGRGVHLGDTILGLKGRIVFEAPASMILIKAHQEMEKLVLSKQQLFWKKILDQTYGDYLHHGLYFEPLMRDIEAFVDSGQHRVEGRAKVVLNKGNIMVIGMKSPFSLMDAGVASYGETSALWNGAEAAGFAKLFGLGSMVSYNKAANLNKDELDLSAMMGLSI